MASFGLRHQFTDMIELLLLSYLGLLLLWSIVAATGSCDPRGDEGVFRV